MAREVAISAHPIIEPGVCGKCGTQHSSWFVDLGFDTVFNYIDGESGFTTWCDGIVYMCAECMNSLFEDLFRAYSIYARGEDRELTPLKMIPITLDRVEREEDGDSRPSGGDDSGDSEGVDEIVIEDERDDDDAAEAFKFALGGTEL